MVMNRSKIFTRRPDQATLWALTGVYMAAMYTFTIWLARPVGEMLRSANLLRLTVGLIAATAVVAAVACALKAESRARSLKKAAALAALSACVSAVTYLAIETPEEAVHLVEYGALSFLLFQALDADGGGGRYLPALVITFLVGVIDELVQIPVPDRSFDSRDILFNGLGGSVGLCFTYILGSTHGTAER